MTESSHQAPDSPEVGDVETESLYGAPPDGSAEPAAEEADPDEDVPTETATD